jgi:hypothetical protein
MVSTRVPLIALLSASAFGCSTGRDAATLDPAPEPDPAAPQVDARAVLIRASVDIRGVRPSIDELARIEHDQGALEGMLDELVSDPRAFETFRDIFSLGLRTRRDRYQWTADSYFLDPTVDPVLQGAIAEEVPNLIGWIALTDAPYTDAVRSDIVIVDPVLTQVWPLVPTEDQPDGLPLGTVRARYTDGRPAAGVLSMTSMFWRHTSTVENANRGRVNAITSALLCEDYLDRAIDFPRDIDLTNSESIRQAIRTNEGCQACHATLDPLGSHLWGFLYPTDDPFVWARYHKENERMWEGTTEAPPAFFGVSTGGTLRDLGEEIAADPRFVSCAVERVYEAMLGRPKMLEDDGQLAVHREAFLASGLRLRSLVRSVLGDPAYRGLAVESAFGGTPAPTARKLATPDVLSRQMAQLTGYRMTVDGRDATRADFALRAVAGGSDRGSSASPSTGHVLVHRRLAEAAARALVSGASPESRLGSVLAAEDLSSAPRADLLATLLTTSISLPATPDSVEVAELDELYTAVHADSGDANEAWTAVLTAILSDPELSIY